MNHYFLPEGYASNDDVSTIEEKEGDYWTKERIRDSLVTQYHVYKFAKSIAKNHNLKNIVDVGCGYPKKLDYFFRSFSDNVIGVDQPTLERVINRDFPGITFLGAHLTEDNLSEIITTPVHLVICSDVIEHVDFPERLLHNIIRISNQNTFVLFSTIERDVERGEGVKCSPKKDHMREWNMTEFHALLSHYGFSVLTQRCFPKKKRTFFHLFEKIKTSCQIALCRVSSAHDRNP